MSFWNFLLTGQQSCKVDSTIKYDKVFFKTLTVWLVGEKKKSWHDLYPGAQVTDNPLHLVSTEWMLIYSQQCPHTAHHRRLILTLKLVCVSPCTFPGQINPLWPPAPRRVSSGIKVFTADPYTGQLFVLDENVVPAVKDITIWGEDFIAGLIRWEAISNQKATFNWNWRAY